MNASGGAFWNEGAQKGKHYAIFAFPRCVVRLEGKFCLPQTHSALLKSCQEICNQFNMSCGVFPDIRFWCGKQDAVPMGPQAYHVGSWSVQLRELFASGGE